MNNGRPQNIIKVKQHKKLLVSLAHSIHITSSGRITEKKSRFNINFTDENIRSTDTCVAGAANTTLTTFIREGSIDALLLTQWFNILVFKGSLRSNLNLFNIPSNVFNDDLPASPRVTSVSFK